MLYQTEIMKMQIEFQHFMIACHYYQAIRFPFRCCCTICHLSHMTCHCFHFSFEPTTSKLISFFIIFGYFSLFQYQQKELASLNLVLEQNIETRKSPRLTNMTGHVTIFLYCALVTQKSLAFNPQALCPPCIRPRPEVREQGGEKRRRGNWI